MLKIIGIIHNSILTLIWVWTGLCVFSLLLIALFYWIGASAASVANMANGGSSHWLYFGSGFLGILIFGFIGFWIWFSGTLSLIMTAYFTRPQAWQTPLAVSFAGNVEPPSLIPSESASKKTEIIPVQEPPSLQDDDTDTFSKSIYKR